MITEGIGEKSPAPRKFLLDDGALRIFLVEANKRAEYRKYANTMDAWRNGLLGSLEMSGIGRLSKQAHPIFCGFLGEYAVGNPFGVTVDTVLKKKGDGGIDLTIFGLTFQIKTTETPFNMVRVRTKYGSPLAHPARVFVFCEWEKARTVWVRGWIWTKDMFHLPEVPARCGDHTNIEPPSTSLLPWSALVDELSARKAAQRVNL